ncbi:hypothetical protein QWZ08_25495 [Ferruginibacter paludis]|uniref:hypothetical protein n=1 Tax=Ferruginibacter paludis TaxID=1310417 RepID=UPI0025B55D21|nr:hypothetical protein [Ferruginibacter paludis]MDN3659024.1 hypothetical protein [Ferruginibacter paludis]
MKKHWIKKGLMFFTFFVAVSLLVGFIVMGLWNAILPAVLGVKTITFVQALGILLLSKILFGGFKGGPCGSGRQQWKARLQEKMGHMTPEEKEKFKAEWRNRCGGRWGMQEHEQVDTKQ